MARRVGILEEFLQLFCPHGHGAAKLEDTLQLPTDMSEAERVRAGKRDVVEEIAHQSPPIVQQIHHCCLAAGLMHE